jgi:hypothetical protein
MPLHPSTLVMMEGLTRQELNIEHSGIIFRWFLTPKAGIIKGLILSFNPKTINISELLVRTRYT